jgi:hypothetical protein
MCKRAEDSGQEDHCQDAGMDWRRLHRMHLWGGAWAIQRSLESTEGRVTMEDWYVWGEICPGTVRA